MLKPLCLGPCIHSNRVAVVRERTVRPDERAVFENDTLVQRVSVLNFAVVSDDDSRADVATLTDHAVTADFGAWADVTKVPDLGALANLGSLVDVCRLVVEIPLRGLDEFLC